MSSNSNSAGATTLGDRVNFFDSQTGEFDLERDPKDPTKPQHDSEPEDGGIRSYDEALDRDRGGHSYAEGTSYQSYVGNSLLHSYGNPVQCCPRCKYEDERYVELSEPLHHLPLVERTYEFNNDPLETSLKITKNDHRRHRHCTECGYVSFGGTLRPRDLDDLLTLVDVVLDGASEVVLSSRRNEILRAVRRWKQHRDLDDETILERVILLIQYPLEVEQVED